MAKSDVTVVTLKEEAAEAQSAGPAKVLVVVLHSEPRSGTFLVRRDGTVDVRKIDADRVPQFNEVYVPSFELPETEYNALA